VLFAVEIISVFKFIEVKVAILPMTFNTGIVQ